MDHLLKSQKVIVCAGSGGVGKTTVSAALAVRAAELGLRVLVLTIDPARRLANALGIETFTEEEVRVPNQAFKGELWAAMIDPKKVFDRFVQESTKTPEEAERILRNKLYIAITTSLSGSQEFSSLERLYQASQSDRFDLVILDTPPAQHAKEFLLAPERFFSLFQNSVIQWFLTSSGDSFFSGIVQRSTQAVIGALESLTGSEFIGELKTFFLAINDIQSVIADHSVSIHRMLTSSKSGFVVVTSFDEVKLKEARNFQKALSRGGYVLLSVIVNRAYPMWLEEPVTSVDFAPNSPAAKLKANYTQMRHYFTQQREAYALFQRSLKKTCPTIQVPELLSEVHDLSSLSQLGLQLSKLDSSS